MSDPTKPTSPTPLKPTPISGDWKDLSDDAKLVWLNQQPMVDDNTISIGSCVAHSAKISDYCCLFIDLINAVGTEVQSTSKDSKIPTAVAKFVDVVAGGLWKFNEQIVTDCDTVFLTGKYGTEPLFIRPTHVAMPKVSAFKAATEPKSNIAGVCVSIRL
jgi:hypothetical protein